jgi:ATP-dependent helicase/DNAse subunit B
MAIYSHSRISTFEQCRYKYKLQYIDKVKVDVPTTVEAFMGGLVHKALEIIIFEI